LGDMTAHKHAQNNRPGSAPSINVEKVQRSALPAFIKSARLVIVLFTKNSNDFQFDVVVAQALYARYGRDIKFGIFDYGSTFSEKEWLAKIFLKRRIDADEYHLFVDEKWAGLHPVEIPHKLPHFAFNLGCNLTSDAISSTGKKKSLLETILLTYCETTISPIVSCFESKIRDILPSRETTLGGDSKAHTDVNSRATLSRAEYEILGVSPDASDDECKDAYYRKILETHPDRNPSATQKEAEQNTKNLNAVHEKIKRSQRRN